MIPLHEIDPEQVKHVRSGEASGRDCGKTIERMVTLLSYVRPQNVENKYLFIGENHRHVRDICHCFSSWIKDLGVFCDLESNALRIYASFEPIAEPSFFMARYTPRRRPPSIIFDFATATNGTLFRGMCYNKIIVDLTPETYRNNAENIERVLWTEKP